MKLHIKESIINKKKIDSPQKIASELKGLGECDQETFWLFGLNNNNKITLKECLFKGEINSCNVDRLLIYKRLLTKGCQSFIIVHNHPSGNLKFSTEDHIITKQIINGANIIGLSFLDHVLIAGKKFLSFKETEQ